MTLRDPIDVIAQRIAGRDPPEDRRRWHSVTFDQVAEYGGILPDLR